jgi:methylenetetrahydrofolate dehydrogenase (NADP+)/methenyltetrahydrofolate cyclohydrolase
MQNGAGMRIDGAATAASTRAAVARGAAALAGRGAPAPGLATVLVGDDPASRVYVASKQKAAHEAGFHSERHLLPADATQDALLTLIGKLNADPAIHGILVQLPLPKQIDSGAILDAIAPEKDVDGFHPMNVGRLATGDARAIAPCTPAGAMILIRNAAAALGRSLAGLDAVVVGRSNIVGKPMAQLLLAENMTVTIAHSRTRDLPEVVRRADVVIAAVGRPLMVKGDWIKPGAIVIDVGINRIPAPELGTDAEGRAKTRLVGDVDYAQALPRAGAITPVPGGVGPMTIAMLMANTLAAAERAAGG